MAQTNDVRKIITGLANGRRRRPMTDAEWLRRYDPQAAEHQELIAALRDLKRELAVLVTQPSWPDKPTVNTPKPFGGLDL